MTKILYLSAKKLQFLIAKNRKQLTLKIIAEDSSLV